MGLDTARKDLQLDVTLVVERDDPSNPGIGIVVSDHDLAPDFDRERGADIGSPHPESIVVGHGHEVDGDVVLVRHVCILLPSLPFGPPAGVGDGIVEGGQQREPCGADTTERRQADTAVDDEPQWC